MRAALCNSMTVARPARPGATNFGPPEKPAKKCGSTNPVEIRTSASTHSLHNQTGTSSACPTNDKEESSRASWQTTRHDRIISGPSMSISSAGVLARWVPVATRTVTSAGAVRCSSSARSAFSMSRLGCGRVPSQTETTTRCPGRTWSRSGRVPMGLCNAVRKAKCGSDSGVDVGGFTTSTRPSGSLTTRPSRPYARRTSTAARLPCA